MLVFSTLNTVVFATTDHDMAFIFVIYTFEENIITKLEDIGISHILNGY